MHFSDACLVCCLAACRCIPFRYPLLFASIFNNYRDQLKAELISHTRKQRHALVSSLQFAVPCFHPPLHGIPAFLMYCVAIAAQRRAFHELDVRKRDAIPHAVMEELFRHINSFSSHVRVDESKAHALTVALVGRSSFRPKPARFLRSFYCGIFFMKA